MHRKKPTSTRQKKAEMQLKRAIKRGDAEPPEPKPHPKKSRPKARLGPAGVPIGSGSLQPSPAAISSRKLQSRFVALPPSFLAETKDLASTLIVPRPIPAGATIYVTSNLDRPPLMCPRRPKWRYDMSKKELEANEEGLFRKWLEQTDNLVLQWRLNVAESLNNSAGIDDINYKKSKAEPRMPQSPTYFERNLEVWRQLWRVTEISDIILVLLDSRCPLVHYPPSLQSYLTGKNVILVLTKVDISGAARVAAWSNYLQQSFPGTPVVQVESYTLKDYHGDAAQSNTKKLYEPHIPLTFRERLVSAIRDVHEKMLEPPERIRSNPEGLTHWKPLIKREIDWKALVDANGKHLGTFVNVSATPQTMLNEEMDPPGESPIGPQLTEGAQDKVPDVLTIGLIGQPNVGKSSLLNALFGVNKVRASKTPGKTKHFQTLFWTPDVRLVDCPGLVMPNYTPLEMQVLSGTLPISNVSAVPACIYYASCAIPLEQVFRLTRPNDKIEVAEMNRKRTWRDGMQPLSTSNHNTDPSLAHQHWTAMEILVAYANLKGWVTAKAGRPDIHRAGNAILRLLAEGKIAWGFWPTGTQLTDMESNSQLGAGIWITQGQGDMGGLEDSDLSEDEVLEAGGRSGQQITSGVRFEEEEMFTDPDEEGASYAVEESSEANTKESNQNIGASRFAALMLNDQESDHSPDDKFNED